MQIRKVGNKLRLIRNVYDSNAKRGKQVQLGSIPNEPVMPDSGLDKLTEAEVLELRDYIDEMKLAKLGEEREQIRSGFDSELERIADALNSVLFKPEKDACARAYAAMDSIAKYMRDKGFSRKSLREDEH